jgi:hypothetical protein
MKRELNGPLLVLEIAGLQHFSLKSLHKKSFSLFRGFYLFLLILFLLLIAVSLGNSSFFLMKEKLTAKNALLFTILSGMSIGMTLVVFTSLIQSFISINNEKNIFVNGDKIISLIRSEFSSAFNFNNVKCSAWKKLIWMTFGFVIIHVIALAQMNSTKSQVACLMGVPTVFYIFLTVYKFTFYIDMINHQLATLGGLLTKIFDNKPIQVISIGQISFMKPTEVIASPMRRLRAVRNIYNVIQQNANLINASNGLSVLILITCLVVSLTIMGYKLFIILALEDSPSIALPGKLNKTQMKNE